MKLRSLLGGACGLMLAACGGADQQEATAGEAEAVTPVVNDEAALTELTDYYQTHYNMHHASMVADVYTDEAVFLAANGSILEGPEAITGYLQEGMDAMTPELTIDQVDQVIGTDYAVARGTYSVSGEAEGEAAGFSGAFMNIAQKVGDEWKLGLTLTNYDNESFAEMYEAGADEGMEPPPEAGTLTGLYEAWETHYNLGHASMVADLYTADAQVAFGYGPWMSGTEALTARLEESIEGSPQIDIHAVETVDLGNGLFADAGWYEISVGGEVVREGTYALLVEQSGDGEAQIRWHVSNGSP